MTPTDATACGRSRSRSRGFELGTQLAGRGEMFLKRSIGGHHVLARIALGVAVACALALAGLLGSFLVHEVFR